MIKYLIISLLFIAGCSSNNQGQEETSGNYGKIFEIQKLTLDVSTPVEEIDLGESSPVVKELTEKITVKNTTEGVLSLSTAIEGQGFKIKVNRCSASLAKGKSCDITVLFSNRGLYDGENYSGTLSLNESIDITLKASVVGMPNPNTAGTPSLTLSLNSPFVPLGNIPYRTLTIVNEGTGVAKDLVASIPSEYSIRLNRCPTNLSPKQSCYLQVLYKAHRSTTPPPEGDISISLQDQPPVVASVITAGPSTPVSGISGITIVGKTQGNNYKEVQDLNWAQVNGSLWDNQTIKIGDHTDSGFFEVKASNCQNVSDLKIVIEESIMMFSKEIETDCSQLIAGKQISPLSHNEVEANGGWEGNHFRIKILQDETVLVNAGIEYRYTVGINRNGYMKASGLGWITNNIQASMIIEVYRPWLYSASSFVLTKVNNPLAQLYPDSEDAEKVTFIIYSNSSLLGERLLLSGYSTSSLAEIGTNHPNVIFHGNYPQGYRFTLTTENHYDPSPAISCQSSNPGVQIIQCSSDSAGSTMEWYHPSPAPDDLGTVIFETDGTIYRQDRGFTEII